MGKVIFIVGSGRNGSELMVRLLNMDPDVICHHEYQVHQIQPIACRWAMQIADPIEVKQIVNNVYVPAVWYSDKRIWANSCNKASWLLQFINKEFPHSKIVHLARDGRRVCSSFYHKLSSECYSDRDVRLMRSWLDSECFIRPPYEKRFWWPIPPDDNGDNYDRWKRICWNWNEVNTRIIDQLSGLPRRRHLLVRLEELVRDKEIFKGLFEFLGVKVREDLFDTLDRPDNVRDPKSYPLTLDQEKVFFEVCGEMMHTLGYTGPDYEVKYIWENKPAKGKVLTY